MIRTYFTSLNQPPSPLSQVAKTQRTLLQMRPDPSLRRASLSTQEPRPNNGHSSANKVNDAHDTPETSASKHTGTQTHEYPSYIRRLTSSLPPLHRPTRDEMLALATGFWERMKIRFKWFTIRGFRKFNTDDMSAFLSWFVVSQAVWIMVGTTTFFSVVFATFNSLRMQEFIARQISNYLTKETGWTVVFESAIVPKWKDGQISFKRTYISRHPDFAPSLGPRNDSGVSSKVHPAHTVATRFDAHLPTLHDHGEDEIEPLVRAAPIQYERLEDLSPEQRITTFDLEVDSVDVELSFKRWLDGKGLVQNAVIKGVRGVVDRRLVSMTSDPDVDLASFRHPGPGFEVESLQLEDVLVTIYQPNFRPYTASIFQADFRLLRKQWLFYDLLSAKSIVGQFDNCLFSLHEPQSIGRTMSEDLKDTQWKRMSRLRIDGVNIDHLQAATGTQAGPISWITAGKFDAVLDIKFPRDESEADISSLFNEIAHNISVAASGDSLSPETLSALKHATLSDRIPGQRELAKPALRPPVGEEDGSAANDLHAGMDVVIDIDLRFRDLKAAVPLFTRDISYGNQALVRPIVAFINANRTLIPIHCTVVKPLTDFEGSWTPWETGLTDAIAIQIYEALAYHVTRSNMNRRIKAVSTWSLQMTANAVISALRNIVDPVSAHLREISSDEHLYLG